MQYIAVDNFQKHAVVFQTTECLFPACLAVSVIHLLQYQTQSNINSKYVIV